MFELPTRRLQKSRAQVPPRLVQTDGDATCDHENSAHAARIAQSFSSAAAKLAEHLARWARLLKVKINTGHKATISLEQAAHQGVHPNCEILPVLILMFRFRVTTAVVLFSTPFQIRLESVPSQMLSVAWTS